MIPTDHEFRGGQVFRNSHGSRGRAKLLLAKGGWVLDPIPSWRLPGELNQSGGMLWHDANGKFHFSEAELRVFLKDWSYVGKFCELYDLQGVEENKYAKMLSDNITFVPTIEEALKDL